MTDYKEYEQPKAEGTRHGGERPVEFHERLAEFGQQVLLKILNQDITRLDPEKREEFLRRDLRNYAVELMNAILAEAQKDPEKFKNYDLSRKGVEKEIIHIVDALINDFLGPNSIDFTTEFFISLPESLRKIIRKYFLFDNPVIMPRYNFKGKNGFVYSEITQLPKDRAIGFVVDGTASQKLILVEGRLYALAQFKNDKYANARNRILTIDLENDLMWNTVEELAMIICDQIDEYFTPPSREIFEDEEALAEYYRNHAHPKQTPFSLVYTDVVDIIRTAVAIPVKERVLPSVEELEARKRLVDIIRKSSPFDYPIANILSYAENISLQEAIALTDGIDQKLSVETKLKFTWRDLLAVMPTDQLRISIYVNVLSIADAYEPVVNASIEDQKVRRTIRSSAAIIEMQANQQKLIAAFEAFQTNQGSEADLESVQLLASAGAQAAVNNSSARQLQAQADMTAAGAAAQAEAAEQARDEFIKSLPKYKEQLMIMFRRLLREAKKESTQLPERDRKELIQQLTFALQANTQTPQAVWPQFTEGQKNQAIALLEANNIAVPEYDEAIGKDVITLNKDEYSYVDDEEN